MFDKFIGALKTLGKVKRGVDTLRAKLDAADDDLDLDGKPQYVNVKESFDKCMAVGRRFADGVKALAKSAQEELIPEVKELIRVSIQLIEHIASAGQEEGAK